MMIMMMNEWQTNVCTTRVAEMSATLNQTTKPQNINNTNIKQTSAVCFK